MSLEYTWKWYITKLFTPQNMLGHEQPNSSCSLKCWLSANTSHAMAMMALEAYGAAL